MTTAPTTDPRSDVARTQTFVESSLRRQVKRIMLVVTAGPDNGSRLQTSRGRVTIGRSGVNDLVLTDTLVSGIHVELLVSERGVLARDLESTNGTTIGELRIREAWMEPGMALSLGETTIELRATDEVPVTLSNRPQYGAMWGDSPAMRQLFAVLERVARTDMSVLIGGETGSGKELVARAMHDESPRAKGPFVVLDCGSLPHELAEAAILGHKKGS
ncbi:MAG: sigma 54-interacting transcriptional regulator, partial [Nannocystaceae bacterium]